MSGIINKVKDAVSGDKHENKNEEQSFSIQPHPAKTNDPADLQRNPDQFGPGSGLSSQPEMAAHHAKGPHVPSESIKASLPDPATREELGARSRELNA
ncbi:hypothetical protein BDV98DRAFT_513412 [Pterulicium gracile]|uniref:Uncharacterized protein n=1 Tax=Pterulicium gracile TaxID=1884261 RepID=A0A5C3Q7D5_9AGAR|nr:hypothetical protein BDV98DRAFT_513412 [Pterula gracilis]